MPLQIHQIWIGTNAKPEPWLDNVRGFAADNGFPYKLWDEKTLLESLDWSIVPGLRETYDEFPELAGKSDILRLLLLHQYGGVYIDCDIVVLNPERVNDFLRREEERGGLFASWEDFTPEITKSLSITTEGRDKLIANSILGAAKSQHPFWKGYLEYIVHNRKQNKTDLAWVTTGPLALTKLWEALKEKVPEFELYDFDTFYPVHWHTIKKTDGIAAHEAYIGEGPAMFFQYGYSTNGFKDVFNEAAGLGTTQKGGDASRPPSRGGIPKHIHQIWLGKNPRPEPWIKTVREFAAKFGYKYTMWTEKEADSQLDWNAVPGLRRLYGGFHKQLAGRADLIRLLALYQYGGIYVDADSVIMKPEKLDKFLEGNHAGVFFAWEHIEKAHTKKVNNFGPELEGAKRLIANGVIGAAPKHPFFRKLLEGILGNAEREVGEHAWRRVGPLYVTRIYTQFKKQFPDVHIYPMKYFYPRHWKGIKDPELHKKVRIPKESMMFQYGYSTNKFAEIFRARARATRKKRRAQ
jgi:mannosyltransferase OCH1-like enzyme